MSSPETQPVALKRSVGLFSLTLIAAGGILGSGWLFSPLETAHEAGPASIISWVIGATAMMLVAFSFAEVASVLPVPGGIARIPRFTHGDVTAGIIGWTAWVGYCTQAPIEAAVVIRYAAQEWPALVTDPNTGSLSLLGLGLAGALLVLFVIINALGAAAFARANSAITVIKFAFPLIIAVTFLVSRFDTSNFTDHGGFMPYGWHGVLSAVSTGGIVFALVGFRHAIDMAGETRNAARNVPLALIFGLLVPLVVYIGLQVAFIGALPPTELANGWKNVEAGHGLGPLAAISMALGISWLTAAIYGGALLGPAGGALVATGSNARLAYALSRNRFLPRFFEHLSTRGIPARALILNFVLGFALIGLLPFGAIVAVNSAAIVLSFSIGPVAVLALRRQMPDAPRHFDIPFPRIIAAAGFVVSALIVYWSDWTSVQVLLLIVAVSLVFMTVKRLLVERESWRTFDLREAIWLVPFLGSLALISWLGNFGGLGVLPFGWDLLLLAVVSLLNFRIAVWCSLDKEKAAAYREKHRPQTGEPVEASGG